MSELLMRVEGTDGQVELMNDRVVVVRSGIMSVMKFGANSKREIPLGAISEVVFKAPTFFGMGEIEFVRSGNSSSTGEGKKKVNHNMVKFKAKQKAEFEALKEKIFEMINQNKGAK
ncbi:MAG: DUF4429 domain-containing protein [Rickettsiales bacterium]|jgi:hypothetical protein